MRRSRGLKSQKSDVEIKDEDIKNSVNSDNGGTQSVKASTSTKKRVSKGRGKVIDKDVQESQSENEKIGKKRKKETNESTASDSDTEINKSLNLKKSKQDNINDSPQNHSDSEIEKSLNKRKSKSDDIRTENGSVSEIEKLTVKKNKEKLEKESNEKVEEKVIEENIKLSSKRKNKAKIVQKENENNDEYEVEKIVSQRVIKGRRQFLVRWKGYGNDADTWEQENKLNCDVLIEEFLVEQEESNEFQDSNKEKEYPTKTRGQKHKKKDAGNSNGVKRDVTKNENDDNNSSTEEYEVEKIIDVHYKKDKKREFLIRWKGFSSKSDTWEPEEYLNCPELINKFMEKLEKITSQDSRELRTNPTHTNRYNSTMYGDKRHSRRNINKERKTYYE